jgi:hypothetical protein
LPGKKEKEFLATSLEEEVAPQFAEEFVKGNLQSQEVLYIRALALLLQKGLTQAERAITFTGRPYSPDSPVKVSGEVGSRCVRTYVLCT